LQSGHLQFFILQSGHLQFGIIAIWQFAILTI
jgi:hypothetical protein